MLIHPLFYAICIPFYIVRFKPSYLRCYGTKTFLATTWHRIIASLAMDKLLFSTDVSFQLIVLLVLLEHVKRARGLCLRGLADLNNERQTHTSAVCTVRGAAAVAAAWFQMWTLRGRLDPLTPFGIEIPDPFHLGCQLSQINREPLIPSFLGLHDIEQ